MTDEEQRAELLAHARHGIDVVQRYVFRLLADAEKDSETSEARALMRMTTGLRRKLYKERK